MKLRSMVFSAVLVPALALAEGPMQTMTRVDSSQVQQTAPTPAPAPGAQNPEPPGTSQAPATVQKTGTGTQQQTGLTNAAQAARQPVGVGVVPGGFTIAIDLDHYLGIGTFINPSMYSYLAANITAQPRYAFTLGGKRFLGSVTMRASYEYTMPDSENARRFQPGDTRLGLAAPAFFKEKVTGISFTPSFGIIVPTSPESWQASLIANLTLGVLMARSVGRFDFFGTVGASRGIHANPVNAAGHNVGTLDAQGNQLAVCRQGEPNCAFFGMNTAWTVSGGINVNYRATDALSFTVGYSLSKAWRYVAVSEVDELTPKAIDGNGNSVARVGLGQNDRSVAFVSASYQLNDYYSLSLSTSTIQAPLSSDGHRFRFPFWSFEGPSANYTTVNLTLSAFY